MSLSVSSSLSSVPSTEDEAVAKSVNRSVGLERYFKPAAKPTGQKSAEPSSPPQPKRAPSPPHEYVLADNPDIAFIVMFRSRFSDAFPKSLPHYGPQDIERGVQDAIPGEHVEKLLCALLGLVLNRKKDVERGHFQRALEEAVQTHTTQWPQAWAGKNPLHGGGNFSNMPPVERLVLLKTLILWSLHSSETVQATLKESYKQARYDDDLNQPLSVQPWGRDGYKRRYWLIEGQDDTHFRLYRESNPALKTNTWWSIAGTIDEVRTVADRLEQDTTQHSKRLRERISAAIPRFEASEEKRKRRDYRLARKAAFSRPEPGFSLYEGRTRGKKMKYTFSDEEEETSDANSVRRSNRQSGISTPADPAAPTVTASGRQVKARFGGAYGESMLSGLHREKAPPAKEANADSEAGEDEDPIFNGRPQRVKAKPQRGHRAHGWKGWAMGQTKAGEHIDGYNSLDELEDESEASSSGNEWDGGEGDEEDANEFAGDDEDEEMSQDSNSDEEDEETNPPSLLVQLRYRKKGLAENAGMNGKRGSSTNPAGSPTTQTQELRPPNGYEPSTSQDLKIEDAPAPDFVVHDVKSTPIDEVCPGDRLQSIPHGVLPERKQNPEKYQPQLPYARPRPPLPSYSNGIS